MSKNLARLKAFDDLTSSDESQDSQKIKKGFVPMSSMDAGAIKLTYESDGTDKKSEISKMTKRVVTTPSMVGETGFVHRRRYQKSFRKVMSLMEQHKAYLQSIR